MDSGTAVMAAAAAATLAALCALLFLRLRRALLAGASRMEFGAVAPALKELFRREGLGGAVAAVSVGAGYPANLSEWERSLIACGARVVFVEPGDSPIARALSRLPAAFLLNWDSFIAERRAEGRDLRRVPARLEASGLPEKFADAVVMMSVMSDPNLRPEDRLLIARGVKRILKPGGLLVLGYFSRSAGKARELSRHEEGLRALEEAGLKCKRPVARGEAAYHIWTAFRP